jgi:hypothetical protein
MSEKEKIRKVSASMKPKDLPTQEDISNGLPDQPFWNMKHYLFLKSYRETLDIHESAKIVGIDAKGLRKALDDPKIRHAMEDAKEDFIESLNLTPAKGAKKFMQVYNKIEKRFDEGDSKVAAPLANMAATFLKATGQLSEKEDRVQTKVSINISLSNDKPIQNVTLSESSLNLKLINGQ